MKNLQFKYVSDGVKASDAVTLDDLFGNRKVLDLPYQSYQQLEAALKGMNMVDMQALAIKMGIKPSSARPQLIRGCLDQFNRLTKTYGFAKKTELEENSVKSFDPSKF